MKHFCATVLLLIAAACTSAQSEPRAKSLDDATPEPSAEVAPPGARADTPMALIGAIYGDWRGGPEGAPSISVEMKPEGAGYVAVVVRTGLADDSVAAIKDVLQIIMDRGGNWFVTSAEQYRKCYRTGLFEWTAKPCP